MTTEHGARRAGAIDALYIVERALEKHCQQQHPEYAYPHTAGDQPCARCVELLARTEEIAAEIFGASLMAKQYAYAATVQQKVDWLLAHQELWQGYGGEYDVKVVVVGAMKRDRMFSKDTYAGQVDLQGLINRARKKRRERGYECDDAA